MRRVLPLALVLAATPALAQPPATPPAPRAEVLVLGVYHLANPGRDIFNMKADDVLAPRRQAEIAELVAVLKKFRPTKVAIERDAGDERPARDYADYLAGKHELTRNDRQAHLGEPGDWAGPDLVADWFRRNVRIHNNVTRLVGSPDERVLAIFGAGHLGWLRQNVASDPTLRLRKLAEFVK